MKIIVKNVNVSFGAKEVLKDINLSIEGNEKIAIVGRNGAGKTTLLKVILKEIEPDFIEGVERGEIIYQNVSSIGYQKQITFSSEEKTLEEEVLTVFNDLLKTKEQLEALEEDLKVNPTEKKMNTYVELEQHFRVNGGYDYQKLYSQAVKSFGFTESDKSKRIKEFSGGERTRIALIKLLLKRPELLVLDEPTNHLDIKTIEWLEEYLKSYTGAVIIVSHDRAFLDNIVSSVIEIEHNRAFKYAGNYSKFITSKKENYEKSLKERKKYEEEVGRLQTLADRFRYKATKAKMAQSKLKAIEKMEEPPEVLKADNKTFKIKLEPKIESGLEVVELNKLKFGYTTSFGEVNFKVYKGDRIAVIGANGTGKTTLIKTIASKLSPLGGKIKFGTNVEMEYFDQQVATIKKSNSTVLEDFLSAFPDMTTEEARTTLGSFMFTSDDVFKTLSSLSGGELVRLELLKIFKRKPNLLVLDEPTNNLDILSKEKLEECLLSFKGTIIFVSHDRYFVNKLATGIIAFTENGVKELPNTTYTSYVNSYKKKVCEPVVQVGFNDDKKQKQKKENLNKNSKEQAKKLARIEREIGKMEEKIATLNAEYNNPAICSNAEKLMEISRVITESEKQLNALMEEWLNLTN